MTRWVTRWLPRGLFGQMLGLLVLVLVLSQAVVTLLLAGQQRAQVTEVREAALVTRAVAVARFVRRVPPSRRPTTLARLSDGSVTFTLVPTSPLPPETALPRRRPPPARLHPAPPHPRPRAGRIEGRLVVAVPLPESRNWVIARATPPPALPLLTPATLWSLSLLFLGVVAVVWVTVRRVTRPVRALAEAAEALGRGQSVAALPEEGPREVRQAVTAFNTMHQRLQRFLADRTRLLAAMSHDLRTPLTRLRLWAELVEEPETRTRLLGAVDDMQALTEDTLAFAREDATARDAGLLDLTALVTALAEDLHAAGQPVDVVDAPTLPPVVGRPVALRRALANLVDNAVRYGGGARLSLRADPPGVVILVEDNGPGLPTEALERAFDPFERLGRDRDGSGLGLAVARSVARAHGGEITLGNRPQGGLCARLWLPAPVTVPGKGDTGAARR